VSRNKNADRLVRLLTKEEVEQEDRTFWHSKTPAERLAAAEQLRQAAYGYDPASARIQEIIEIAELKRRKPECRNR
jgi:hypothetical protein